MTTAEHTFAYNVLEKTEAVDGFELVLDGGKGLGFQPLKDLEHVNVVARRIRDTGRAVKIVRRQKVYTYHAPVTEADVYSDETAVLFAADFIVSVKKTVVEGTDHVGDWDLAGVVIR